MKGNLCDVAWEAEESDTKRTQSPAWAENDNQLSIWYSKNEKVSSAVQYIINYWFSIDEPLVHTATRQSQTESGLQKPVTDRSENERSTLSNC